MTPLLRSSLTLTGVSLCVSLCASVPAWARRPAASSFARRPAASSFSRRARMARDVLRQLKPNRSLSFRQRMLVQRAHRVGAGRLGADRKTPARIGNYSFRQLLRKARILKRAGFDRAERRALMKRGVVGDGGLLGAFLQGMSDGARAMDSVRAAQRIRRGEARPGDGARVLGWNSTAAGYDAIRSASRGDARGAASSLLQQSLFGNGW